MGVVFLRTMRFCIGYGSKRVNAVLAYRFPRIVVPIFYLLSVVCCLWSASFCEASGNDSYTKLLLHLDGDQGSTGHVVTVYGDPDLTTSGDSKWDGSMYFDGTGDYLSIPDSNDWDLFGSADDATVDFWVKHKDHVGIEVYVGQVEDDENLWRIMHYHGFGLRFHLRSGATNIVNIDYVNEIADSEWHHIALVKNGNDYTLYKDGEAIANVNDVDTDTFTSPLFIGENAGGTSYPYDGCIDELRITKGVARWTSNFTPPTRPYEEQDQDSNTKLHLHFDGDVAKGAGDVHYATINGDPDFHTTGKFNGSMYFDGTGDYLSIPDSDDWDFGSGDFTIEFWFNVSVYNKALISQATDANTAFAIQIESDGSRFNIYREYGGTPAYFYVDTSDTISLDEWHHFAYIREGDKEKAYLDGVLEDSADIAGAWTNYSNPLRVGVWGTTTGYCMTGYIDELRISKGIARWTSNFTPPTKPYTQNQRLDIKRGFFVRSGGRVVYRQ